MKPVGIRTIGGRHYYAYKGYKTKMGAQLIAGDLRRHGLRARVIRTGGEWVVFQTKR